MPDDFVRLLGAAIRAWRSRAIGCDLEPELTAAVLEVDAQVWPREAWALQVAALDQLAGRGRIDKALIEAALAARWPARWRR